MEDEFASINAKLVEGEIAVYEAPNKYLSCELKKYGSANLIGCMGFV